MLHMHAQLHILYKIRNDSHTTEDAHIQSLCWSGGTFKLLVIFDIHKHNKRFISVWQRAHIEKTLFALNVLNAEVGRGARCDSAFEQRSADVPRTFETHPKAIRQTARLRKRRQATWKPQGRRPHHQHCAYISASRPQRKLLKHYTARRTL